VPLNFHSLKGAVSQKKVEKYCYYIITLFLNKISVFQHGNEGDRHGVPDPGADGDGVTIFFKYCSKELESFPVRFFLLNCKKCKQIKVSDLRV